MIRQFVMPLAAVLAFMTLSACTTPVVHNTPSGKVEQSFDIPPDILKPMLVNGMISMGFNITRDTNYQIAFDKPVNNIMMAAFMGSKFNAIPNERVIYTIAPLGGETRVVADISIITNPGSGFEQVTPLNNGPDSAQLQSLLDKFHDSLTSHATNGHTLRILVSKKVVNGALIATVIPGGIAAMAGFKDGDIITGMNGKPVGSVSEFQDMVNATTSSDVDYAVDRQGRHIIIKVHFGS